MALIRKYLIYGLLLALAIFAGYVYVEKRVPCVSPIQYTIGSFDTRFGISSTHFLDDVARASHVWENAYGKDLFEQASESNTGWFKKYFGRAPILMNLVYDERQEKSVANRNLVSQIDDTKQTASEIKAQFLALQNKYAESKGEYQVLLANYKNRRGDWGTLEQKRIEVNTLADSINALVKKYNYLVGQVNTVVDQINQTAGQEFEEGRYVRDARGERITIYEFENRQALVRVLAHELGHAIGLEHNDNPNSIMYYLNNSKNLTPTSDDIAALKAVCVGE